MSVYIRVFERVPSVLQAAVQALVSVFEPAELAARAFEQVFVQAALARARERGSGFAQGMEQERAQIPVLSGHAFRLLLNFCQTCILCFYL